MLLRPRRQLIGQLGVVEVLVAKHDGIPVNALIKAERGGPEITRDRAQSACWPGQDRDTPRRLYSADARPRHRILLRRNRRRAVRARRRWRASPRPRDPLAGRDACRVRRRRARARLARSHPARAAADDRDARELAANTAATSTPSPTRRARVSPARCWWARASLTASRISLGIPAIGIHHLEGHLLSPLLADPAPSFPFVALLVSGGHTQLLAVEAVGRIGCSASRSTMQPAKRSTRPRRCSACRIRAARCCRSSPTAAIRRASGCRGRCSIRAISISASAD